MPAEIGLVSRGWRVGEAAWRDRAGGDWFLRKFKYDPAFACKRKGV